MFFSCHVKRAAIGVSLSLGLFGCGFDSCLTDKMKCPPGTECVQDSGGDWVCKAGKRLQSIQEFVPQEEVLETLPPPPRSSVQN